MASCVKCGKPIGLLEYIGDAKQLGLCKKCRKTHHWCDQCINFITITIQNSPVTRCLKYGYDLSNKKDWKTANNCPDYTSKTATNKKKQNPKKPKQQNPILSKNWTTTS
jgi:hypothetical protein